MAHVFDFKDYKKYLLAEESSDSQRAFRSRLAEAAHCQNAYVSQVLNGSSHFSLEQLDGISTTLLKLANDERQYLLLLGQLARAATPSLRKFFAAEVTRVLDERLVLRNRVHTGEEMAGRDQVTYYGEWYYSAIHVLVTISRYRRAEKIAERLHLELATVRRALEFLVACGLLTEQKGEYGTGKGRLFLGSDSPLINRHHANWRLATMQALYRANPQDLHYSSVVTVSEEDSVKIREMLIQAIQNAREEIRKSPEEDVFSFCVDFYRL